MVEEVCEVCGGAIHYAHYTERKWWHDDVVALGWYSHPERQHAAVRKVVSTPND